MLMITKANLPPSKESLKCPHILYPDGIVIHNTANDASATTEISYMQSNSQHTSFHFAVDNEKAVQGIEINRNAWHAGDGSGASSANRTKISIEICYSKSGGARFARAEENSAVLAAKLCKKYGWGTNRITRHKDYKATDCPYRTDALGWQRFIDMVQKELDKLNGDDSEIFKLKEKIKELESEALVLNSKLDRIRAIYEGERLWN